MFLANRIIEFTNAQQKGKKDKFYQRFTGSKMSGLLEQFNFNIALDNLTSGLPYIRTKLNKAQKYEVNKQVMDAVEKMYNHISMDTLNKAFHYAKPPFPVIWIEWPSITNPNNRIAWLLEEKIENNKMILEIRSASVLNTAGDIPLNPAGHYSKVTENGIQVKQGSGEFKVLTDENYLELDANSAKNLLVLLLLMNSRSNILTVNADPIDDSNLAKARFKRSKISKSNLMSLRPITFDISRILKKNKNLTEEQARELQYMNIRSGHFKLRQTGVFWWSPHRYRVTSLLLENEQNSEVGNPRDIVTYQKDRRLRLSNPNNGFETPGGEFTFD